MTEAIDPLAPTEPPPALERRRAELPSPPPCLHVWHYEEPEAALDRSRCPCCGGTIRRGTRRP